MSKYETIGGTISLSDTQAKLVHHLREAQDQAATAGHILKSYGNSKDDILGQGWLAVSEMLGNTVLMVTKLSQGRLN
jgi:hypothetical protein